MAIFDGPLPPSLVKKRGGTERLIRDMQLRLDAVGRDYELLKVVEAASAGSSLNVTGIPQSHRNLMVVFHGWISTSSFATWDVRFEDSGSNVNHRYTIGYDAFNAGTRTITGNGGTSRFPVGYLRAQEGGTSATLWILNYTNPSGSATAISFHFQGWSATSGTNHRSWNGGGFWINPTFVDRLNTSVSGDNFQTGTRIEVYGVGRQDKR